MYSGNLWRVLGLCLLSVGAWGQEAYEVSISGTKVTLTCPEEAGSEIIEWEKDNTKLNRDDEKLYFEGNTLVLENFSEMDNSGFYSCYTSTSKNDRNFLYLKARVCENCMEVDLMAVATIIIVDICITFGLLLLVYYWSKNRKAKAKPVTRGVGTGGKPRGQNKERPPPVPNPDYEPIRKGQRDLYSGLNQRGI
ncbi:T-cell surface glycoprotein CD3 epsilon chain [Rousettus aegyptiacus]|uniref:T-cell surface glycoprotein CD3 epsilon chain n=1 Tax=Rousettus aegyptiacus TaxID=9407 RepID=A0A7J8GWG4_ROUAE|nr:T-cell surface glycoprotein CD3 epsilon chain [Rousettus aegyptiacus]XP_016010940.1 T-cell surface glycoprotein CD3 epsilon chain [Rousettus aegyptiacus]KAF6464424.1 CD3e molecule [Rousettus aegyptiacus]